MSDALTAFLEGSWNDHGTVPDKVVERFPDGLKLLSADAPDARFVDFAKLIEHTTLGHLAAPEQLAIWIERLRARAQPSDAARDALARAQFALAIAQGKKALPPPLPDDQVLAAFSNGIVALCRSRGAALAGDWLDTLAAQMPGTSKARIKAIAGAMNNLYFHLSTGRHSSDADGVMIKAAVLSRDAWAQVGTWKERERGEYFIALAYVAAGHGKNAREHASACLAICEMNQAPPYEFFFGHEAMARASHVEGLPQLARSALDSMAALLDSVGAGAPMKYCRSKLDETAAFIGVPSPAGAAAPAAIDR